MNGPTKLVNGVKARYNHNDNTRGLLESVWGRGDWGLQKASREAPSKEVTAQSPGVSSINNGFSADFEI